MVEVVRLSGGYDWEGVTGADEVSGPGVVDGTGCSVDDTGPGSVLGAPVGTTEESPEGAPVPETLSVTGQTVVETGIVSVTRTVEPAGQFVTSGAHEVTV